MLAKGTLDGRVALVTGGGTGLGRVMALELGRLGARVAVAGRRSEPLEEVAREVGDGLAVPCDVRDPEAVAGAFDAAERELGPVTTLVNNAAGNFLVRAEDLSPNGWRAVLGIVLDGTFFCSRELGRRAIERGGGGQIVNVVATYAWTGGPGTVHSAAAKRGTAASAGPARARAAARSGRTSGRAGRRAAGRALCGWRPRAESKLASWSWTRS